MDDFGLLVGRHFTALPTLTDTQLSELQLDSSGRLIISGRYLEDSAHTSGDAGIFVMAVANHTEGALHSTDGDYAALQVDSSGRLRVIADVDINGLPSEKLEDSAHTSGDSGMHVLAVRQDTLASSTSADGDYGSFKVNSKGELYVVATDTDALLTTIDGVLDSILVDTTSIDSEIKSLTHVEDAAHSTGDVGMMPLAVRRDVKSSLVSTDGDYAPLQVDADGDLRVTDEASQALLTTIDAVLDTIKTDTAAMVVDLAAIEVELLDQGTTLDTIEGDTTSIDATLTALSKAEDSVHSSGDQGIMSLAVQQTADAALAADGDYAPLQVDENGFLKISGDVTFSPVGSEEYTVTDALAAAGDGLETITAAATPWVTVATFAHTSGTAYLYGYQWACDQNSQMRIITDDTTNIVVYKTDINSSAMPGTSEQFSEGGRIEIAGGALMDIKMQIKKRATPGGNANGTGSLHIRK